MKSRRNMKEDDEGYLLGAIWAVPKKESRDKL